MAIGAFIRRMCGPFERFVSKLYRGIFFNLKDFVAHIKGCVPDIKVLNILEVGCGDGFVTELLAKAYPNAHITGIDIVSGVGKLYKGDPCQVAFQQKAIHEFVDEHPDEFDIVVICDVMHHIPVEQQRAFLESARKTLKKSGYCVLKEWVSRMNVMHVLVEFSDRYISNDPGLFKTRKKWRHLVEEIFGEGSVKKEAGIRPWSNNMAFFIEKL